eukprot:GHVO01042169.1.p1 GENE.GHVO01042169.1~~GHVO01042169.1.p1  ORF type:complete len:188 (+),score=20.76 GHVO01042169.1:628-1191(+)
MNKKTRILMKKMEEKAESNKMCDVLPLFQELTLDVIGESAFGIEIDSLRREGSAILRMLRANQTHNHIRQPFYATIPELRFKIYNFFAVLSNIASFARFDIIGTVGKVAEMRRKQPQRNPPDLMQLMIDAEATDNNGPLEIYLDDEDGTKAHEESVDIKLSEAERKRHAGELAKKKLTTEVIIIVKE